MKTKLAQIKPFSTKDGSLIRELMHPTAHGNRQQSLAQATVAVGASTHRHYHRRSEELYHVTAGSCEVVLGPEVVPLGIGDTLLIPAGTHHHLRNTGQEPLQLLCMCSPAYAHDDTVLVDNEPD